MSQAGPIDFWFSIGSLYTYLSVMRIDRFEDLHGVTFRWRPFSLRAGMLSISIMIARTLNGRQRKLMPCRSPKRSIRITER